MKTLFLAAAALALSASAPAPGAGEPDLDAIRTAAERFQDVNVAIAEGYMPPPGSPCETAEGMGHGAGQGSMGIHYFRPDLLGITAPPNPRVSGSGTHPDFSKPAILIYEPQADGSLQLVAVENLVFEDAWRAAGHDGPPTFHGRPYEHMVDDPATPMDEAHMFAPHYDRHVWVFRDNPSGVFAPFNPNVHCPSGMASAGHHGH